MCTESFIITCILNIYSDLKKKSHPGTMRMKNRLYCSFVYVESEGLFDSL